MRVCSFPRCPTLVEKGRCPEHAQDVRREQRRYQTGATAYNSARWVRLRDQVISEEPDCVNAGTDPRCTLVTECVDHKIPHRGDEALFYDRTNLQGMCTSCHSRKTAEEVRGRFSGSQ